MIFPLGAVDGIQYSRVQDATNMPGPRDCFQLVDSNRAADFELTLAREDPPAARDWDLLADRRRDAWLRCPFSAALDELFVKR